MSTDDRLDRFLAEVLDAGTPTRPPDRLEPETLRALRHVRRWPRWLALIKEPPMRTSSGLAVGSPMVRVAAVMVASLLLALTIAGAGIAGSRLLAADGVIVVDQDGSGHFATIQAAVDVAEDGDEIIVKPGTYAESVTIARDITLRGEDRETVILDFGRGCQDPSATDAGCPASSPDYAFWYGGGPFGILVESGDAEISHLTISGPDEEPNTGSIVAAGGGPTFSDITVIGNHPMYIGGGSSATVRDSDLADAWGFVIEPSEALIEDSSFFELNINSNVGADGGGPGPVIRGNRVHGITLEAPAIVEGNEVIAPDEFRDFAPTYGSGIDVIEGVTYVIRDNVVSGFDDDIGISAIRGSDGEIVGNRVTGGRGGISVGSSESVIRGNTVSDTTTGYVLSGTVDFVDNVAERVTGQAVILGGGGSFVLAGNRACGNGVDLVIVDGADVTMGEGNEFCVVEGPE